MASVGTEFDQLQQALESGGVADALNRLAEQLRERKRYHELFEALKMQVRHQLGLPLTYSEAGDDLAEDVRTKLENGLLDACREVGMALLSEGSIREGWMYLRPVGDQAAVAKELAKIEPDEDNLEELIEVSLHEAVDPARGFALVLEHHGTCNSITMYESTIVRQEKSAQQAAAGLLVEHLHAELLASVKADIAQQEGEEPSEKTLRELVADCDWLFGEHSYHLDTTHLASTVRFSRVLEDERLLRLAYDLTAYGSRLSQQFQYQGEPPFEDIYPSHALYLGALLGENVDQAVEFFRTKAELLHPEAHGSGAVEAYVQLLDRLGRPTEAVDALLEFAEKQPQAASQVVPLILELSERTGDFSRLVAFCREQDDLLGFATATLSAAVASR
jgi:hypothetical protein